MEYSLFLHRYGAEPFVLSGPPARHLSHCPEGAANKPAQGKTTRAQASVVAALGQSCRALSGLKRRVTPATQGGDHARRGSHDLALG